MCNLIEKYELHSGKARLITDAVSGIEDEITYVTIRKIIKVRPDITFRRFIKASGQVLRQNYI